MSESSYEESISEYSEGPDDDKDALELFHTVQVVAMFVVLVIIVGACLILVVNAFPTHLTVTQLPEEYLETLAPPETLKESVNPVVPLLLATLFALVIMVPLALACRRAGKAVGKESDAHRNQLIEEGVRVQMQRDEQQRSRLAQRERVLLQQYARVLAEQHGTSFEAIPVVRSHAHGLQSMLIDMSPSPAVYAGLAGSPTRPSVPPEAGGGADGADDLEAGELPLDPLMLRYGLPVPRSATATGRDFGFLEMATKAPAKEASPKPPVPIVGVPAKALPKG